MNANYENKETLSVLIIDDSPSVQKYVKELLENVGFSTLAATNGQAGLEMIESKHPDVVLLDIEMPVMTGLEVLDALDHGSRLYSIILFSHLSGVKKRVTGFNKGADDYITKPINPEELIARVIAATKTTVLKKELAKAKSDADSILIKYLEMK